MVGIEKTFGLSGLMLSKGSRGRGRGGIRVGVGEGV